MTYKNKETNVLYWLMLTGIMDNNNIVAIYHPLDFPYSVRVMNEDQFYSEFEEYKG